MKIFLLLGIVILLSGCSASTVGGDRYYGKHNVLESRNDNCKGACLEYSSDGSNCVKYMKGISEVCLDYFNNIER